MVKNVNIKGNRPKKAQNRPKSNGKRVLMALSGGIDSAVSAWKLIQDGYEVEAAFMKNYAQTKGLKYDECPWLTDRQDALRVAAFLGIPMHTVNFEKEYEKNVLNYFFKEYSAGRTPNPDVMCNKEIKFKLLYNWAMKNGFDYIATGHYAQIGVSNSRGVQANKSVAKQSKKVPVDNFSNLKMTGETQNRKNIASFTASSTNTDTSDAIYTLNRSADDFKDQTYFIYNITTPQLQHILFPIGSMKKSEVRELAKKINLPNAEKRESMGLCFVGKIRLKEFLDQKLKPKSGAIVTTSGKKIGEHEGLAYYTIGQRQGVRVGADGPWFVVRKDLKKNELVVINNPKDKLLQVKEIEIHSVNWITPPNFAKGDSPAKSKSIKFKPVKLKARFRHQGELQPITVELIPSNSKKGADKDSHYKVTFSKPQLAIASGQSLVMYDGKVCVGGGVIV